MDHLPGLPNVIESIGRSAIILLTDSEDRDPMETSHEDMFEEMFETTNTNN